MKAEFDMNKYFLKKADDNLPEIKRTEVRTKTPHTVLDKGDSLTVDLGDHYVGYLSFKMWYVDEYIDAPVTLKIRFFETEAEIVAEKLAELIKNALPEYLWGEWVYANTLANLPVLETVVECLIEKGVLTPPENGIGAEGCWMSVKK